MSVADDRLDKDGEWLAHLHGALKQGRFHRFILLLRDWIALTIVRRLWKVLYVPRHVAFIMDGNRRWAKQHGLPSLDGHASGFESLVRLLEWSLELGVNTVTVYAFSILNFNRPKEEVDGLMHLASRKFEEFLHVRSFVMRKNVRVRIIGDIDLLPNELKRISAQLMLETAGNTKATLNVCLPYTSGEEMTRTVKRLVQAVRRKTLLEQDVDQEFFMRCLYTREAGSPEILVRTSGEVRLSDFMVWQARFSHFYFLRTFWPQINIFHMLWCILDYQLWYKRRCRRVAPRAAAGTNPRKCAFLEQIEREERKKLEEWVQLTG